MVRIELIGVPFDGYGRPGHQARAAAVLREVGLVEAFSPHDVLDGDDVVLPAPVASRGARTSLINEPALLAMIELLRHRVAASLRAGRFPVVIGADCTTLLGSVPASRAEGRRTKLLFVDGHEDTMPLDVSEDGEAANCEIGLLLGLTGRLIAPPLLDATSLLAPDDLVVLGTRDQAWRRLHNVGTLADVGVWCRTSEQVAQAPADQSRAAVRHLRSGARGTWWLHVDLDVLDPDVFTAQGLPGVPDEPGGLTWDQLRALTEAALSQGGCVGLSVAIYDPDQDPDRTDARKVVDWVGHMAHSLAVSDTSMQGDGRDVHDVAVGRSPSLRVNIVGVPNSAGAYCVGVEDAPAALRRAGLVEALVGGGADVLDAGDLTARRWVPDRQNPWLQNLDEEVAALRELADAAAPLLRKGSRLLVLGGSCTVALGVCAAIRRVGVRPRLVYVDRHLDLNTASTTAEGSLS